MEIPQTGRAIINETFNHVEIIIPVKKNYLLLFGPLVGLIAWWLIGGKKLFSGFLMPVQEGDIFGYIFMGWFCFIMLMGLRTLWWALAGKEIINVGEGVIFIKRQGDWFARAKSYDLNEAAHFRFEESYINQNQSFWGKFQRNNSGINTICFEYGADTIQFGEALSEAEGNYILQRLKAKKVLTERHFELSTY